MKKEEVKERLEAIFQSKNWSYSWDYDKDKYMLRVTEQQKPFEISVPTLMREAEKQNILERINEVIHQVEIMINSVEKRGKLHLQDKEQSIYPVMRSRSFPTETEGKQLIWEEHTAESNIFYAIDLGESYTLIDSQLLEEAGWTKSALKEKALFNLRRLGNEAKQDQVAGNTFYFISKTDGFSASRVLNQSLIQTYADKAQGELCVAIPHQDVCIIADILNDTGYDVLGQICFQFFAQGQMPITALPFKYLEAGKLEPIFILARRKPKQ